MPFRFIGLTGNSVDKFAGFNRFFADFSVKLNNFLKQRLMKKTLLIFLLITSVLSAQKKDITLDDLWTNYSFRTDNLEAFSSMKNGDYYIVMNYDRNGVYLDKYNYATLEKEATVLSSTDLPGIQYFEGYSFSDDETKILLATKMNRIYRHSYAGIYYVYDIASKKLEKVSEKKILEPTFSPDGKKVAYAYQNNLYVKDLTTGKTTQITTDGKINAIINGTTDWVYEEEFGFVRAFQWNGNSDKIAFIRFDESEVPEYTMDIYGKSLYPEQMKFKYPKAGEKNADVSLHLYNLNSAKTQTVKLGAAQQYYIPRIKWTDEPNTLAVTTLNRHQNNLNLIFVDANTFKSRVVLNEKDPAYIDINDNLTFLDDNRFIWTSEKDGRNHIYLYDKNGKLLQQVTKGNWEVTKYYGYDKKNKTVFYQSTEEGSINRSVYSIKINGKGKKKLSNRTGNNRATFSHSFKYFVNTFSDADTPNVYTLNDARTGKELKMIKNNEKLLEKLAGYRMSKREFSVLKTANGNFNMWMIKPTNFDPDKKYPLFLYQYSGPGSQSVMNTWYSSRDYWHLMLAEKGIIVACIDGRGTGYKGRDFKKVTYKELGKYEIIDQIESAKELAKLPYIDAGRIGIWGWSYGGYMSSLAITKGADVFKMAIAVAPVTSWRFYDTVYTERYMQTPQENPDGYDQNSPLNFAHLLKGDYLLIHGSGDDNVHYQNSARMIDALIEANKQFDFMVYPDRTHGIYKGKNTRLHLFEKMTTFIERSFNLNTK